MPNDQHIPYENLGRYLNNDVDPAERAAIDGHLEGCPGCRQDVADARAWQTHITALPGANANRPDFPWLLCAALAAIACLAVVYWFRY